MRDHNKFSKRTIDTLKAADDAAKGVTKDIKRPVTDETLIDISDAKTYTENSSKVTDAASEELTMHLRDWESMMLKMDENEAAITARCLFQTYPDIVFTAMMDEWTRTQQSLHSIKEVIGNAVKV